jgi:hypothetical protein
MRRLVLALAFVCSTAFDQTIVRFPTERVVLLDHPTPEVVEWFELQLDSGAWATAKFKAYNLESAGKATNGGYLHALMKVRAEFRSLLLEMGCVRAGRGRGEEPMPRRSRARARARPPPTAAALSRSRPRGLARARAQLPGDADEPLRRVLLLEL